MVQWTLVRLGIGVKGGKGAGYYIAHCLLRSWLTHPQTAFLYKTYFFSMFLNLGSGLYCTNFTWSESLSYSDIGNCESFHIWLGVIHHFDLSDKSLNNFVNNRACNCVLATPISFLPSNVNQGIIIVKIIINISSLLVKILNPVVFMHCLPTVT